MKHGGRKAWRMAVSRKADPLKAEPCAPLPALTPIPNPKEIVLIACWVTLSSYNA